MGEGEGVGERERESTKVNICLKKYEDYEEIVFLTSFAQGP